VKGEDYSNEQMITRAPPGARRFLIAMPCRHPANWPRVFTTRLHSFGEILAAHRLPAVRAWQDAVLQAGNNDMASQEHSPAWNPANPHE
jgi:hypothetical protein